MLTKRRAVATVLGSALLFGTSGTAQALGPAGLTPVATAGVRLLAGAVLLTVALPAMGHDMRELAALLRSGHIWLAAGCVCVFQAGYFTSAQLSGVALGALVTMGSIPLLTGLAGTALGHRITGTWLVSTLVCATGLVLLGYEGVTGGGDPRGIAAAALAAAAGAGYTLTVKHLLDRSVPALPVQAAVFLIAGAVMAVAALLTQPMAWVATPQGVLLVAWLAVLTMAVPNILWIRGLGVLSPGVTSTLLIGEPLTATVLGVVLLDERLSINGVIGLIAVTGGLVALGLSVSSKRDSTADVVPAG